MNNRISAHFCSFYLQKYKQKHTHVCYVRTFGINLPGLARYLASLTLFLTRWSMHNSKNSPNYEKIYNYVTKRTNQDSMCLRVTSLGLLILQIAQNETRKYKRSMGLLLAQSLSLQTTGLCTNLLSIYCIDHYTVTFTHH